MKSRDEKLQEAARKAAQQELEKSRKGGILGRLGLFERYKGQGEFKKEIKDVGTGRRGEAWDKQRAMLKRRREIEFPRMLERKERELRRQSLSFPEGAREKWFERKMSEFKKQEVTWWDRDVKADYKRQLEAIGPQTRKEAYEYKEKYADQLRAQKEQQRLDQQGSQSSGPRAGEQLGFRDKFKSNLPYDYRGRGRRSGPLNPRSGPSFTNPSK